MRRIFIAWLAGLALIVAIPSSLGQSGTPDYAEDDDTGYEGGPIEVTMYHHVYNLLDKVPMNTQPMDDAVPDLGQGFLGPHLSAPGAENPPGSTRNFLYMYNSPGPVHYNTSLKEPRFHPERGLAEDLHLAADPIKVYWFMSADALETEVEGPAQVGVIPQLHVRATLRLGDDIGGDLDAGQLVAQGETVLDLVTEPNAGPTEIEIDLGAPQINVLPADESFNLKVEWYQVDDGGVEFTDRQWNVHTGTAFPNRMVMTIENPLRINYVHPQPIGDRRLAFHTAFVTPFGNYDVDLTQLDIEIRDSAGNVVQPETFQGPIIVQKSWVHNHHFEPVLSTWVWDYRADNAPPGDYTLTITSSNYQGTATATKTARFSIAPEGRATGFSSSGEEIAALDDEQAQANESPMGLAPLIIGLTAAAALATHRRRK